MPEKVLTFAWQTSRSSVVVQNYIAALQHFGFRAPVFTLNIRGDRVAFVTDWVWSGTWSWRLRMSRESDCCQHCHPLEGVEALHLVAEVEAW